MLFYSKLNCENKTYDFKFLLIMPHRFSNDLFALEKCRILYIDNLTSKKKFGYQAVNEHSADKVVIAHIFEI